MVVDHQEDQHQGVSLDASMGGAVGTGHAASGLIVMPPVGGQPWHRAAARRSCPRNEPTHGSGSGCL